MIPKKAADFPSWDIFRRHADSVSAVRKFLKKPFEVRFLRLRAVLREQRTQRSDGHLLGEAARRECSSEVLVQLYPKTLERFASDMNPRQHRSLGYRQ